MANYNNRDPTPIDGTWDVVEVSPNVAGAGDVPAVIFFERNRAYLCVFKSRNGSYEGHHFEVNAGDRTIGIRDHWLQKGAKLFDGSYDTTTRQLRLQATPANRAGQVAFVLKRRE